MKPDETTSTDIRIVCTQFVFQSYTPIQRSLLPDSVWRRTDTLKRKDHRNVEDKELPGMHGQTSQR